MARFRDDLDALIAQLDPVSHEVAIDALLRCRSLRDLERQAQAGWLDPPGQEPRLKLIRHGSGAFMVVEYEDGWSTRKALQPFASGRR